MVFALTSCLLPFIVYVDCCCWGSLNFTSYSRLGIGHSESCCTCRHCFDPCERSMCIPMDHENSDLRTHCLVNGSTLLALGPPGLQASAVLKRLLDSTKRWNHQPCKGIPQPLFPKGLRPAHGQGPGSNSDLCTPVFMWTLNNHLPRYCRTSCNKEYNTTQQVCRQVCSYRRLETQTQEGKGAIETGHLSMMDLSVQPFHFPGKEQRMQRGPPNPHGWHLRGGHATLLGGWAAIDI